MNVNLRAERPTLQNCQNAFPKLLTEVAINQWINATVEGPEPLSQRCDDPGGSFLHSLDFTPEKNAQAQRVERKPGERKHCGHHDEHAHDANFGAIDVPLGFGARDPSNTSLPYFNANECITDGDETERHQITSEEHYAQKETAVELIVRPLRHADMEDQI